MGIPFHSSQQKPAHPKLRRSCPTRCAIPFKKRGAQFLFFEGRIQGNRHERRRFLGRVNGDARKNNGLNGLESPKVVVIEEIDQDDESLTLLASSEGRLSTELERPKRKVQWVDKNGDKLAQIVEFIPSDESDVDEEDSDSCICRIM